MLSQSENILIVALQRSGGKLLRRLLDGHPAVRAVPWEHWQTRKKGRFPGPILTQFETLSPEEKLKVTGLSTQMSKKIARVKGSQQHEILMQGLMEDAERCQTSGDLYECFANRYFRQFHGIDPGPRVVNHCGNLALMTPEELDLVFGPSTKIRIWRDPRGCYVSWLNAKLIEMRSLDGDELDVFCTRYERAYDQHSRSPGITLKFERLVADPETCMHSVASTLGIEFSEALLTPTTFGRVRNANSSFKRETGAVDAAAGADWESRIDPKDRAAIEDRLGDIILEHSRS